ncbi:unnamed protein product [Penicillium glandicola]
MARMKGVFSWEDVLVQRYQSSKPPPLPRLQAIPIPSPQLQSRLLTRLSPELRLMIWGFVLADQRIHIIQCSKQRLGHMVCPCGHEPASPKRPRQNRNFFCEICHGTGISQPAKSADLLRRNKVKLLGLALTCRQIYHESITLLYTLPTLEFSNPWTLPYLLPTIPAEHRNRIRTIELRWPLAPQQRLRTRRVRVRRTDAVDRDVSGDLAAAVVTVICAGIGEQLVQRAG